MTEQQDLSSALEELKAQLAQVTAELASLKYRAQALPQVEEQLLSPPKINTTRRKALKRFGLALLGGAAAASIVSVPTVQAKVVANPTLTSSTSVAGALVLPPGAAAPTGTPPDGRVYGLVASGYTGAFNLANLPDSAGVSGYGSTYGVYGEGADGVYGEGTYYGVVGGGNLAGVYGASNRAGVYGSSNGIGGVFVGNFISSIFNNLKSNVMIGALALSDLSLDLSGFSDNARIGLYAKAGNSGGVTVKAAVLAGDVDVYGVLDARNGLIKPGGSFKIDHPIDPVNKYLYHSFVESPEMKNIYDGVVTLDSQGEATITLPNWFEALNSDYRYQLTSIGVASPDLHIAEKITGLKFKIAGGLPGQEVSWQVTGIRQDAWAKAHRLPVEEDKTDREKGKYLHPELFGKPESSRIGI